MALHTDLTPAATMFTGRRWTKVLAVGALVVGAVTGLSAPAQAATTPTTTTVSATASAAHGKTVTYNEGYAGSCVFYALNRFHQLTGVYPKAFGDARLLATGAKKSGWTVSTKPRINSIAIFQPGDNGAVGSTGHAAWVEQVSGARIEVAEMNAPRAGVITHRWIDAPTARVRYIYAP